MKRSRTDRLVALTVLALAAVVAEKVDAQNTAIVPAPFQEERHSSFVVEARRGGIECLLMGDSITDWWRRAGIAVSEATFGGLDCANFGIAGDRTQGVLWRMQNGELEGYSPKLMMLMIGTNNLSGRTSPPNAPAEIAMGIAAIVNTFRIRFPDASVLLLGVFPRGAEASNPYRSSIREINALISALDDGEHVRFMDIGGRFLAADGSIPVEVMADGLHPTERGYEIWAEAVMPTFREMLAH
jgi:lysophospholipase L1-like esterase